MSSWKVKEKKDDSSLLGTLAGIVATGGLSLFLSDREDYMYTLENESTGEIRRVKASNEKELGEKISRGDFEEEG